MKSKRIRWEKQADGSLLHYRPALTYQTYLCNLTLSPQEISTTSGKQKNGFRLKIITVSTEITLHEQDFPSLNVAKREARKLLETENDFTEQPAEEMSA